MASILSYPPINGLAVWAYNWATLTKAKSLEPQKYQVYQIAKGIKSEVNFEQTLSEAYHLWAAVKATAKLGNCIAEVGTCEGGSTKLIAIADGGMRPFHAFDTFEGFPKRKSELDGEMLEGTGKADYETVKRYLSSFRGIHLYKGIFPDTATPINNLSFSFVHLDCDVYTPIKAGLEFFYPRMVKGGILISHDYNYKGVRSAFDEVMSNKPEPLMTFSAGAQVMFVKLN